MRPIQAALLSAFLVLMAVLVWWLTGVDGHTPRTADPLTLTDTEREEAPRDLGSLDAPDALDPGGADDSGTDARSSVAATQDPDDSVAAAPDVTRRGRVLDHLGNPIPGAEVYFGSSSSGFGGALTLEQLYKADHQWGEGIVRTETDGAGRYEIVGHDWNPARVAVRAAGNAPYRSELRYPERGNDYPDIRMAPSVTLEGRVYDHLGRAVEGAHVEVVPARDGGLVIQLSMGLDEDDDSGWTTDAAGRFRVDQAAAGPFQLRVSHIDTPATTVRGTCADVGGRVTGIEVHLTEGVEVLGRVTGLPAGGDQQYAVFAQPAEFRFGGSEEPNMRSATLADDGSFRLRGLRKGGSLELKLRLEGEAGDPWGESLAKPVTAMPGDRGVVLEYAGQMGFTLRAVDAETGAPVAEYELSAGGWWKQELRGEDGKVVTHHQDGVATYTGVETRDDGTFDLELKAAGYEPLERKGLKVEVGEVLELGDLRLTAVPELVLRVIDAATLEPIKGARVSLHLEDQGESDFFEMPNQDAEERGRTDAQGIVRISSRPGRSVHFRAKHKTHADYRGKALTLSGAADEELELRMVRGGTVNIVVLDPNGEPIAGRGVSHRAADDDPTFMFGPGGAKETDASGRRTFEHLPVGVHSFRIAEHQGGGAVMISATHSIGGSPTLGDEWSSVTVVEGGEHELTLHAPASAGLSGRITENGKPLVGATLSIEARKDDADEDAEFSRMMSFSGFGNQGGVKTDSDGRFHFEDEEVGSMRLTIEHQNRSMPALFDVELDVGENELDLDLDVTILRGRVTDSTGKPVAGASVQVERQVEGEGGSSAMMRQMFVVSTGSAMISTGGVADDGSVTDADGNYELRGVGADLALRVTVESNDDFLKDGELDVTLLRAGEEREGVDLELLRGGRVRATIAASSADASFISVRLIPDEVPTEDGGQAAKPRSEFLQSPGEVSFSGLEPGTWTLSASFMPQGGGVVPPGGESVSVTIEAGKEATAELVLP